MVFCKDYIRSGSDVALGNLIFLFKMFHDVPYRYLKLFHVNTQCPRITETRTYLDFVNYVILDV